MKKLSQGLLICIEGIDGSGKSVLTRALSAELQKQGYATVETKEPGGTKLGEKIRALLLDKEVRATPKTEFLLFAANRAQHCDELIIPALNEGKIVISDRMADSSLVYQGYVRDVSLAMIKTVNAWAMSDLVPTVTLYLRLDIQTATTRILERNIPLTSFEHHLQKAIDGFEALYATKPNVGIIDATQSKAAVEAQALAILKTYIPDLNS